MHKLATMGIQRGDNKNRREVKFNGDNPTVTMVKLDLLSNSRSRCGEDEKVPLLSKNQMREVHLASHTIRSHGLRVARNHLHDWLILIILIIVDVVLNVIKPFYRFVGEDMMSDLKYPMKSNTIPFWAVPMIAILLPIGIFLLYYIYRKDIYDLHHAILGILFSVLVTAVITDAIKDAVGRPRPDFFWRCFPDGIGVYDHVTRNAVCLGNKSVIKEGHKSFPSGHTSWSFAGLGFLSLYLSGKIKAFDQNGHIAKLCVVFLPLLAAALVGISQVDDYWHHWQDVFAGGLLGFIVAAFCYLQFFPAPYRTDGWGPYAYFQMLTESCRAVEQPVTGNPARIQIREMGILDQRTQTATATEVSSVHGNGVEAV